MYGLDNGEGGYRAYIERVGYWMAVFVELLSKVCDE